jgi:Zn-dependent peptidase ImmA (M78 family)
MALRIDSFLKAENEAYGLIEKNKITQLPIPVDKIVSALGVSLISYDLGDEVSGVLVLNGEAGTIGYNSKHGRKRQRFTIAHELGHYMLHRQKDNFFVDKDFLVKYRSSKTYNYNAEEIRQEQQANAFAAALLMPQTLILNHIHSEKYKDFGESDLIEELALLFDVSVLAMTYRLSNIMQFSESW